MAFMGEVSLAKLWSLVKAEDAKLSTAINTGDTNVTNAMTALANAKAMVATGSYTGTGSYGANNHNSLTLPFAPKIVFIIPSVKHASVSGTSVGTLCLTLMQQVVESNGNVDQKVVSCSGNTITWYSTDDAQDQGNLPVKYYYVAVG